MRECSLSWLTGGINHSTSARLVIVTVSAVMMVATAFMLCVLLISLRGRAGGSIIRMWATGIAGPESNDFLSPGWAVIPGITGITS